MSTNTLETAYANGEIIDASHVNELTLALLGSFVGRNSSGIPASGQSLGTLALPWGNIYASGLVLNGVALDTSTIVSAPNRIVSGKTRSISSMPDFLRANGSALSFQVLGATTNLILSINNDAVSVTTDITKTGVTAAPSTNNTCLVNDTTIVSDKYAGEDDTVITIDTVGSEITARVGQIVALKGATEIMLAYVNSATQLSNVFRGFFFDSSGNPIVREAISNNDTLTLLNLGWVFIEDNGTTVDVSYRTPVYSYSAPSSPTTGDYWYDLANNVWKRYSGASFDIINRTLVGVVVSDATNCIASRCFDFNNNFKNTNNIELEVFSTEIVRTKALSGIISVYGTDVARLSNKFTWNITTNLESPLTEANSTVYFIYISSQGQSIISNEKPYNRKDLQGYYHPYHSWRCVGEVFNNASGNFDWIVSKMYNSLGGKDTTELYLNTFAGRGSTNTAIPYYTNITKNENNGAIVEMSNSSTLGFSITAKRNCFINMTVFHAPAPAGGALDLAISKNSTQLTTAATGLTVGTYLDLAFYRSDASPRNSGLSVSASVFLKKGDVLRPHIDLSNATVTALCGTTITAESI